MSPVLALTDGRLWNGPLLSGQQPTSTRLPGAVASVENDPQPPIGSQLCCDAPYRIPYNDVVGCDPRTEGSTCSGANSSCCLEALPSRGRSRHARSSLTGFAASACCWVSPRTIPRQR